MSLRKLFLALGLLLLIGVWGACVDIPNGPGTITNPDFRSLVRFVNAVPGSAGDMKVDGGSVGSLTFPNATGYLDLPSGSRSMGYGSAAAQNISLGSELQSTILIYGDNGALLLNLVEGTYTKDKDGIYRNHTVVRADSALVRFINVANGAAGTVAFRKDTVRLLTNNANLLSSSAYGVARTYVVLKGTMRVYAVSSGGYQTGSSNIKGSNEVPSVTSATTGTGTVDLSVDGGLAVTATVKSRNDEGFFTQAHLHNGAAGVAGPVLYPISVTPQVMTFKTVQINGAQEVPPVTTTASGTATLTVANDSSATTGGASYSVTTVSPTSLGFFTAAHIHNGPAGVIGGVVHPINVTQQKITFPTTSAVGAQEVPPVTNTTATATCTFTLYRDSLVYTITTTKDQFDSVFTAAHFHVGAAGTNGSVFRTILSRNFRGDTTISGKWTRTDTTAGLLTTALVDSIRNGRVYLNIHSVQRPGGIIRAQLVPSATHTNTFSGRFTATSFFNLRDEFAFSRTYFNFHSAANPNGEMRGIALPDTFSTNDYSVTVANAPDSIGRLLNEGKIYFNFHTAGNPGGVVRGQLNVDAAKGQYSVANQSFTFDAGKLYTLVAAGKGSTFQIIKLDNMLGTTAKPVVPQTPDSDKKKAATVGQTKND